MAKEQLIVVSHAHWDREWYLPFQIFRAKLVELMDSLLALLRQNERYRYFMLDGQTIVLEDYLEVRPERAEEIRQLVASGRLLIGPWYVLPDEFLVDGEALVRNLLRGHRLGRQFGGVMKVGYLPDPFGHIAQMPQLLRGFGIDTAVVWRGVGEDLRHSEFLWRAPDGSEVLAVYLPEGYDNAVRIPAEPGPLLELIGHIRETLEPWATTEYLLLLNGDDHVWPQANLPQAIAAANERLADAELVHGTLPQLFEGIQEAAARGHLAFTEIEGELRSSRYAHLLPGVLSTRMWIKQRNATCQTLLERWAEPFSAYARLAGARTMDARALVDLAWRYLLQNQAHDSICGCGVDEVHEEMRTRFAWVEQIGGDVAERALRAIAAQVNTTALPAPASYERQPEVTSGGALVVFNSESGPRTDFVTAMIRLPSGVDDVAVADQDGRLQPCQVLRERSVEEYSRTVSRGQLRGMLRLAGFGRDWTPERVRSLQRTVMVMAGGKLPDLVIEDVAIKPGRDADTVLVEAQATVTGEHNYEALAAALREVSALVARGDVEYVHLRALRRDEIEVGFVARDVPGQGYKTYQLLPGHRRGLRPGGPLQRETIENEFFSVRASGEDGTLALIDKTTGSMDVGLNAFVDGGDAGDEYDYSPPAADIVVDRPAGPVDVEVREDGPVRWTLRVAFDLQLPVALADDRQTRSAATVSCPVVSEVTLYAGVRRVDITTTIDNNACDHRLRVLFPTRVNADHAQADGQFAAVARPVGLPAGGEAWVERPVGTYPQQHFVDLSDGEVGLAVANRGLPEYEVLPGAGGAVLALTLLRCVGWLSRDDLATRRGSAGPTLATPGAQLLGQHVFHYSLLPHAGDWERVTPLAHWFASPLRAVSTGLQTGPLGLSGGFVGVEPEGVVLSAVKEAEDGDGLIVRLYNPGSTHALARVESRWPLAGAELVNLEEQQQAALPTDGKSVSVPVRAAQIVSLRLRVSD